ncbi:MAG: hypothetical protein ACO1N9_07545 [Flavobacterium sp.]
MKKLLLLLLPVIAGLSVSSCSDSTEELVDRPYGEMTMIVDGVQKYYNNIAVTETPQSDGSVLLNVTGSQNGDPTEYITFRIKKYQTGMNRAIRWIYSDDSNMARRETVDGVEYDIDSNTSLNGNTRLKGTFSGKLYNTYSQRFITIENGEFNYNYNLPQTN